MPATPGAAVAGTALAPEVTAGCGLAAGAEVGAAAVRCGGVAAAGRGNAISEAPAGA